LVERLVETMKPKVRQRFSRIRFRLKKLREILNEPTTPMRIIRVQRPGRGYFLGDVNKGLTDDLMDTIKTLMSEGKVGDSVTITLDIMDEDTYESLDDWQGWPNL